MSCFAVDRARGALVAAMLASVGLLVAGCGGGPSSSVASLGTPTTSTTPSAAGSGGSSGGPAPQTSAGGRFAIAGGTVEQLSKFAACMRRNGVPNFPDPDAQGVISASPGSIDTGSAQFQQAQQDCRRDLPNGGQPSPAQQAQARRQALAFSACMRSHGEPNFPDPQFSSRGATIHIHAGSGIDPQSQQFQQALQACQKDRPGQPKGP